MRQPPTIIDIEASGFGAYSYPIEIGLITASGDRYCSLIAPMSGWCYWDLEAERVHGISREILLTHGKPVRQVALELNAMMSGNIAYSDGWVVDSTWINQLFHAAGVVMQFRCSMLESILSETQMQHWASTKQQLATDLRLQRHRASTDAELIQRTYMATLEQPD